MKIRVAGDLYDSLANGPGVRYVLFTQGCTMGCRGCHNKHTWSLDGGTEMHISEIINNIASSPFIDGVTISGGDPMEQPKEVLELCKRIKREFNNELDIMIYTGRTIEELRAKDCKYTREILDIADYLVDGKFEEDKQENAKTYTGSSNQRIFDLRSGEEICF